MEDKDLTREKPADEVLVRYFTNELSELERSRVDKHVQSDPEIAKTFELYRRIVFRLNSMGNALKTRAENPEVAESIVDGITEQQAAWEASASNPFQINGTPYSTTIMRQADQYIKEIGSGDEAVVSEAVAQFLNLKKTHYDEFCMYLNRLQQSQLIDEERSDLLEFIEDNTHACHVASHQRGTSEIAVEDVKYWLSDDSTRIHPLVRSVHRHISIAVVDPEKVHPQKHFGALWLKGDGYYHVIVLSAKHEDKELINDIWCELNHMNEQSFGHTYVSRNELDSDKILGRMNGIEEMDNEITSSGGERRVNHSMSFIEAQFRINRYSKMLVAEYLVEAFRPPLGSSLIFDAGSSPYFVSDVLIRTVEDKAYDTFYRIATNSLPVFQKWQHSSNNSKIRESEIFLYGSEFEKEHCAFFDSDIDPSETERKLLSREFRPMYLYIGSSGIEITENGDLLFGIHTSMERKTKELYFRCHAKRRFVLLSPGKIGQAGGRVFNIFDVENINSEAPIVLVSAMPEGKDDKTRFGRTMEFFKSSTFEDKVRHKGLTIHWLSLEYEVTSKSIANQNGEGRIHIDRHEVVPKDTDKKSLFELI